MNNQNNTNNNNDASLVTAMDEKVEECIKDIMRHYLFITRRRRRINEDGKVAVRNLLYSIHRKEWEEAVNHFLRFYNNVLFYDDMNDTDALVCAISVVLRHMSEHQLQFPLGKEDNFEDFIDLLIGDDDENDDNENETTDRRKAKEILLLLIATMQSNTCVDVINILVDRKGRDFIIKSKVVTGTNMLSLYLESDNQSSIDVVNRLIEVGGRELVIEKGRLGYTTLDRACESSNPSIDIVNRLIEVGGRELVMAKQHGKGYKTLLLACQSSNPSIDIVNQLIEVGGRELVMEKGEWGYTTLHWACRSSNPNPSIDIVNQLIEVGGRELVMEKSEDGYTVLHWVCQSSNPSIDIVNRLIDVGGRELVMEKSNNGNTTLHWACRSPNPSPDVVNRLIDVGGRELVMKKGNNGKTTLHCACESSNPSIDILNRLIGVGGRELVMEKSNNGNTTLHWACRSFNPSVDVVNQLIDVGGRDLVMVQRDNNRKCHPLLLTFYNRIEDLVVKTLIEKGLWLDLGGEFGIGGLFNCCTTTNENGNTIHDHLHQIRLYERRWNDSIVPAFRNEELKALLNGQPILHAAIIAKAPLKVIQDIINYFPQSVTFQDSKGKHTIDVAFKEGLKWDDGLKLIVEQFANQQGRTMMNVATHYGVGWNGGMEQVVEANEEQIGVVDDVTNLYPFMLAAVGDTTRNCDLSTVYNLMKRRPDLVKLQSTTI